MRVASGIFLLVLSDCRLKQRKQPAATVLMDAIRSNRCENGMVKTTVEDTKDGILFYYEWDNILL